MNPVLEEFNDTVGGVLLAIVLVLTFLVIVGGLFHMFLFMVVGPCREWIRLRRVQPPPPVQLNDNEGQQGLPQATRTVGGQEACGDNPRP